MKKYICIACEGLAVGWPIIQLAAWLNENTPDGIHFVVVGAGNPEANEAEIRALIETHLKDGCILIFIGHSMGAMLAYYLGYESPLIIAIDPTCWGSNIDAPEWELTPPRPGQWRAPLTTKHWINFRQASYPGGGVLENPGFKREDHYLAQTDHLSIVNDPYTRTTIHDAIMELLQ